MQPRRDDVVLDVACGAAHLARALAPHVGHVCGVDLTPEMLQQAARLAQSDGVHNLTLQRGDATQLPWIDAQFDLVVCRLTLHQVDDPAGVVTEMVRVTRTGGRLAVVDMIADENPEHATEGDRLERLRDPSHGSTLRESHITGLLEAAGAHVTKITFRDNPLDAEDWMARTQTPDDDRRHIRARLDEELSGGTPTGLRPHRTDDGRMMILHRWAAIGASVSR